MLKEPCVPVMIEFYGLFILHGEGEVQHPNDETSGAALEEL
jgi:hypothetical protein